MDITYNLNNTLFNYRVACIIRKNNTILLEQKSDVSYLSLPGGRVKIGEDSITAIKREIKEETGFNTKHLKTLDFIENFYISNYTGSNCHEILIIHELEFTDEYAYQKEVIQNQESPKAKFIWVPLIAIKNIKPSAISKYLENNNFTHIINKDSK